MDLRERITRQLIDHGVRPTKQRVDLALQVLANPCHFSAEQLLGRLRGAGTRISKATVYNTLSLFSRHGLLKEIAIDPERLVYDSRTTPHHHFYNVTTGELTDIDQDAIAVGRLPALPAATEAESVEVLIRVHARTAN